MTRAELQQLLTNVREKRRVVLLENLSKLLAEPWGRALAWTLIYEFGQVDTPSIDVTNDRVTAYNEGIRAVGLAIAARLQEANIDGYAKVLTESPFMLLEQLRIEAELKKTPKDNSE